MPLTTITVDPYAQADGSADLTFDIVGPPTYFGGGSLSDDSDASGATIGAEFDTLSQHHGEPVALWFKTPAGFDPFALLLQTRMRNTADALAYTADADRQMVTRLSSADNTAIFHRKLVSPGGGNPSPVSPILLGEVAAATDLTWFGSTGAASIDLDNPSEGGGWYQLDWSFSAAPGDKDALTGDGLRLDLAFYFTAAAGDPHIDWFDLFEVSLLVAGTESGRAPLRRYPPINNGGSGPTRHWPRAVKRRAGGTY